MSVFRMRHTESRATAFPPAFISLSKGGTTSFVGAASYYKNPCFPELKTLTLPSAFPPESSSVDLPPVVIPSVPSQAYKLH